MRQRADLAYEPFRQRLAGKGPLAEGAEPGQDLDEHQGDAASENVERQTDLAHRENVHQLLNQVEIALGKVKESGYGVCDRCGRDIELGRLEALPWAHYCVDCQGRSEPA